MEEETLCSVCGKPFSAEEWESRHDIHESECALYRPWPYNGPCHCQAVAHRECWEQSGSNDPKGLFRWAQGIEEACDSGYFGSDNYAPAHDAWEQAADSAKRVLGIAGFEELAHDYSWFSREALCCVCGKPFSAEEWESRHDMHEPDCPRLRSESEDRWYWCRCDLVAHDSCCDQCMPS